ncbi:hypothetical protein NPIL_329861, partial [Nephila pilipes]
VRNLEDISMKEERKWRQEKLINMGEIQRYCYMEVGKSIRRELWTNTDG